MANGIYTSYPITSSVLLSPKDAASDQGPQCLRLLPVKAYNVWIRLTAFWFVHGICYLSKRARQHAWFKSEDLLFSSLIATVHERYESDRALFGFGDASATFQRIGRSNHSPTSLRDSFYYTLSAYMIDHGISKKQTQKHISAFNPLSPADQNGYLCKQCRSRWAARYKPSHQDLYCLPFRFGFWLAPLFATMNVPKFKVGRGHIRNLRVKGLTSIEHYVSHVELSVGPCRSTDCWDMLFNWLLRHVVQLTVETCRSTDCWDMSFNWLLRHVVQLTVETCCLTDC